MMKSPPGHRKQYMKKYMKWYMPDYIKRNRKQFNEMIRNNLRKKRKEAEKLFGDKCMICGSTKQLEFHHKSYPNGKKPISHISYHVLKNPDQFMLLCRICHVLIGISKLNHENLKKVYQYVLIVRH